MISKTVLLRQSLVSVGRSHPADRPQVFNPAFSPPATKLKSPSTLDVFDPDVWPAHSSEEAEPLCEHHPESPKKLTKKEQYELADEVSTARNDGCAPVKRALSVLMTKLQDRSEMKTSLSDCNVTLFNFHSTKFAHRLLQRNVGSLVLVESSLGYARLAKDFARSCHKDHQSNVWAYRSDISSLLGIGRRKLLKLPAQLFGETAVANPLQLVTRQAGDETGCPYARSPILMSALPLAPQQEATLTALQTNLLLHLSGVDDDTIYKYGAVDMMTFLDIGHYSHLRCSLDDRLSFMSHSNRRCSSLFNKLFHVRDLQTNSGFHRDSFLPSIPNQHKTVPHEKKLAELGFHNRLHYGVSIRPRTSISLADRPLDATDAEGNCLDRSSLLPFSWWMQMIGRQPQARRTSTVIQSLCPESASLALGQVDGAGKIGDVPDVVLERLFLESREEIEAAPAYIKYRNSLQLKRDIG